MPDTTQEEKEIVRASVHAFINAGNKLSIKAYTRLSQWLSGMTMQEIAHSEAVTTSAVAYTVKRSVRKILAFAAKQEHTSKHKGDL